MKSNGTRESPSFKFQVVLEAIKAEGKGGEAQVARERCRAPAELGLFWAYGVHPVTLANWKRSSRAGPRCLG
jgi:hypothetical protein